MFRTATYDFGARIYDPRLGRWFATDPLEAMYTGYSPYHFCFDSPLKFKDIDGREIVIVGSADFVANTNRYIAKIKATTWGSIIMQTLEEADTKYFLKESLFATSSLYNSNNSWSYVWPLSFYSANTVYYDDNPWKSSLLGSDIDGMILLGHEIFHAYSDEMSLRQGMGISYNGYYKGGLTDKGYEASEKSAMYFENYLRISYDYDNWLIISHGDLKFDEWKGSNKWDFTFNGTVEKVGDFSFADNATVSTKSGTNPQQMDVQYTKTVTQKDGSSVSYDSKGNVKSGGNGGSGSSDGAKK